MPARCLPRCLRRRQRATSKQSNLDGAFVEMLHRLAIQAMGGAMIRSGRQKLQAHHCNLSFRNCPILDSNISRTGRSSIRERVKFGTWGAGQFRLPEIFTLQIGRTAFPIVWAIKRRIIVSLRAFCFLPCGKKKDGMQNHCRRRVGCHRGNRSGGLEVSAEEPACRFRHQSPPSPTPQV